MSQAKQLIEAMRARYNGLQPREQRALSILAWFVVAVTLWLGLWQPLQRAKAVSEAEFIASQADLAWMRLHADQARAQAAATPQAVTAEEGVSLLSTVNDAAIAQSAALTRAEPVGNNGVRAVIDSAGFSAVLRWLDVLQRQHGITPSQLSIERLEAAGKVSATVTLKANNKP